MTLTLTLTLACLARRFTQFFGNCTGCRFDFLAFHIYDCNAPHLDAGAVAYWLSEVKGFGLPIWLTEFNCPTSSVDEELEGMQRVLDYLDSDDQVERYAWFTTRAPTVGLLNAEEAASPGSGSPTAARATN
jgi:hypothetical protein